MGGKCRAWACAGYGWFIDDEADVPILLLAEGERPVLVMPPRLSGEQSDIAFGWAMSELIEQQEGWLALLRHMARLAK